MPTYGTAIFSALHNCPLYTTPPMPSIKKVIFNNPATIVYWTDRSKTVVKANDEPFDPEKGLAMAISKRALGNKSNFNNEFRKWIEENEE